MSSRTSNVTLPYRQRTLDKHDLRRYEPLFAEYLSVQKGLDISTLPSSEVKGRWKSFIGKWNRKEVAQGWYDPEVLQRIVDRAGDSKDRRLESPANVQVRTVDHDGDEEEEEEDEGLGPSLPSTSGSRHGPSIPNLQDIQQKREFDEEAREQQRAQVQQERKLKRKADQERLDELVPRADPGSRERQLEKKREQAGANRTFADAKDSGATEVPDSDLLGEDGIDAYKAKLKAQERQKNEREIRREEVLRARAAEREERMAEHRKKEEKTMSTLRALAEARYGSLG